MSTKTTLLVITLSLFYLIESTPVTVSSPYDVANTIPVLVLSTLNSTTAIVPTVDEKVTLTLNNTTPVVAVNEPEITSTSVSATDEKELFASVPTLEEKPESAEKTADHWKPSPLLIEISTGRIEGREVLSKTSNTSYYAFQGLPYAKPPVGDLRFQEPVTPEKWNDTLKATQEASRCVHSSSSSGSEDCLYLNVYSPKLETQDSLLPVMVWIHGGLFSDPAPKLETFGPEYFIEEGVIVVTISYRVGIFGFLSTEDYAATGNWGLKDQILALKWVQENIEKFGGDRLNVTIFGQGSGSACASILIQSPLTKGLFQRAILQSGTSLNQWAHSRYPRKAAFAVGRLLDFDTNDAKELIERLRKVDYRTLYVVSVSTDLGETIFHNPLDGLVFAPSTEVVHPGAVITNHSHSLIKDGSFNGVSVIVGFNSQEALGSIDVINYLKPYVARYDLFSTRLVPGSLNIKRYLVKIIVAQLIKIRYFGWKPMVLSTDQLVKFVTDDQFARPIYEYIRHTSKYTPTYFYIFSYEGALGVDGTIRESAGVAHGEENNYLWNKDSNINNAPTDDIITRRRLLRLWTNFAKTGNPTPIHDDLLQNVTWPLANIKSMTYLNIGRNLEIDSDLERYNIHFWNEVFTRHGHPPYHTY